jgi:hypothetical protein
VLKRAPHQNPAAPGDDFDSIFARILWWIRQYNIGIFGEGE